MTYESDEIFSMHSREMYNVKSIDADGILRKALKSVSNVYILWATQHKKLENL